MNTSHLLLSFATNLNWPLQQFDVKKNTLLHKDLEEEVHMDMSPGLNEYLSTNTN